jgi:metal-responsive CopG/Arc/MetJ family transcriptional regulator
MVYEGVMKSMKQVRRSVTLPRKLAEQVERIARKKRLSDNRVLVELLEQGLEAQKEKEKAFFAVAERFRAASDPEEIKRLGDEMGRFIFGQ